MTRYFEISTKHSNSIFAEFKPVQNSNHIVILCHGFKGFYNWGFFNIFKQRLFDRNYNVFSFNFSKNGVFRHGNEITNFKEFSNNKISTEQNDLDTVIDFIKSSKYTSHISKISIIGHSRGGGAALISQMNNYYYHKLIALAPFVDFYSYPQELIHQFKKTGYHEVVNGRTGDILKVNFDFYVDLLNNRSRLDILSHSNRFGDNTLLIHGLNDETVSHEDSLKVKKLNKSVKLELIQNASHTFNYNKHSPYDSILNKVINKTLFFLDN